MIFIYRLYIYVYIFGNYSFVKYSNCCSLKLLYVKYFKCMVIKNYEIFVFYIYLIFVGIFWVDLLKSFLYIISL